MSSRRVAHFKYVLAYKVETRLQFMQCAVSLNLTRLMPFYWLTHPMPLMLWTDLQHCTTSECCAQSWQHMQSTFNWPALNLVAFTSIPFLTWTTLHFFSFHSKPTSSIAPLATRRTILSFTSLAANTLRSSIYRRFVTFAVMDMDCL